MKTTSAFLFASVLSAFLAAPGLFAQDYNVIDLGAIGYDTSRGHDINELGQVTGDSLNAAGKWRAFLWTAGSMVEVPALTGYAGDYGYGYGINVHGQVAGESGYTNPFLWDGVSTIDLGNLGGSNSGAAHAINDLTQVVGYASHSSGYDHAFLWQNGTMTDLGILGSFGGRSEARDINNAGQVVGVSATNGSQHAFLWENGVMTDLGGIFPGYSIAYAISENGFIAGASTASTYRSHATLWVGGAAVDLGTLKYPDPSSSEARDVNNLGQVVGWSHAHNTFNRHAFLFDAGFLKDLNDLIPPGSGWELEEAYAINDWGQIVGYGQYQGHLRGFLLEPTSPGFRLHDPFPGTAGTMNTLEAVDGPPNTVFHFIYGYRAGATNVTGCPGLSVDMMPPIFTPARILSDANGRAVLQAMVPVSAAGKTVRIQVVSVATCGVTNLVRHAF